MEVRDWSGWRCGGGVRGGGWVTDFPLHKKLIFWVPFATRRSWWKTGLLPTSAGAGEEDAVAGDFPQHEDRSVRRANIWKLAGRLGLPRESVAHIVLDEDSSSSSGEESSAEERLKSKHEHKHVHYHVFQCSDPERSAS